MFSITRSLDLFVGITDILLLHQTVLFAQNLLMRPSAILSSIFRACPSRACALMTSISWFTTHSGTSSGTMKLSAAAICIAISWPRCWNSSCTRHKVCLAVELYKNTKFGVAVDITEDHSLSGVAFLPSLLLWQVPSHEGSPLPCLCRHSTLRALFCSPSSPLRYGARSSDTSPAVISAIFSNFLPAFLLFLLP